MDKVSYSETERMQIRGIVLLASEIIAPYWPMRTFVHHNPLHGLEHLHFEEAIQCGKQFLGGNGYPPCLSKRSVEGEAPLALPMEGATQAPLIDKINSEMIKWCAAFLDEGHAPWPMPNREKGFYGAWKFLAGLEISSCGISDSQKKIARLPVHPEDAVLESLAILDISPADWREYLSYQLAALPGWAGFIKWRADQDDYEWQKAYPADLVQYLAVRLFYVAQITDVGADLCVYPVTEGEGVHTGAPLHQEHGPIRLKVLEAGYQEQLIKKIIVGATHASPLTRLNAQAVFCIDIRSEPFRRHLEATGNYETFGFAGFFTVFIRYMALGNHHTTDQFPVIMKAKNVVHEVPRPDHAHLLPKHETGKKLLHTAHTLLHDLKENVITPYVMVESLGWFFGLSLIGKIVFPSWYKNAVAWLRLKLVPHIATTLTVDKPEKTGVGFTLQEQVFALETALRMMGMTKNFARLILFCGHGSTSDNNPFESALDCGACGGNAGSPNARVLATIANRPQVREVLAKNGLHIPEDAYFIAGQQNTTTDEVELFDLSDLPPTHQNDLTALNRNLKEAGEKNRQERCARFPEIGSTLTLSRAERETRRRSCDFSQVRPEWGLSGNAAFIIGRGSLTKGINLEGRAFLHSYNYQDDPTGRFLEIILTAPQVVAQWINMEHYFSTVDNEVYGSGSKIYHNVVGRFGIMSGAQSDLRTGLSRQTVMNGEVPYHTPLRLLTLIEAPRERMSEIIPRHRVLQHLYDNEWVHLVALDPQDKTFYRYVPKQGWIKIDLQKENR